VITYQTTVDDVHAQHLVAFFVDWPTKPSPERHLALLHGSDKVVLARDTENGRVVGFVTAVSDGVVSAFLPLLEVLPEYQRRGIGSELVRRMLSASRRKYGRDSQARTEQAEDAGSPDMQAISGRLRTEVFLIQDLLSIAAYLTIAVALLP
jgi:ribosomal protein S18 acetylase RimI-like enzyme